MPDSVPRVDKPWEVPPPRFRLIRCPEKIWGAVKRKLMGESLFLTYFRALSDGEVGSPAVYPGHIQVFELAAGQSVLVQRDSFLFAQTSVQLNLALMRKLGTGFFGGEGFILEKLTGPGAVFIHGGGDFVEFQLKAGEMPQIDTGALPAARDSSWPRSPGLDA
jgi:uncharacterized protein (AIM24 family)